MARPPTDIRNKNAAGRNEIQGDPKRGDEILKRMLLSKPKQHKDMVAERKGKSVVPSRKRPESRS